MSNIQNNRTLALIAMSPKQDMTQYQWKANKKVDTVCKVIKQAAFLHFIMFNNALLLLVKVQFYHGVGLY